MRTRSSEPSTTRSPADPATGPTGQYRGLPAEQETIIRWDREGDSVHLFSADPTVWRRLDKTGLTPTKVSTIRGQDCGRWYLVPKSQFRYKPAGKAIRA